MKLRYLLVFMVAIAFPVLAFSDAGPEEAESNSVTNDRMAAGETVPENSNVSSSETKNTGVATKATNEVVSDVDKKTSGAKSKSKKDSSPIKVKGCEVTPSITFSDEKTWPIRNSNNLIRNSGSIDRAAGEYTVVVGRVFDIDCVPISGAVVSIRQADPSGKYEQDYMPYFMSNWKIMPKSFDKNFGYSGESITNNLGEFSFQTIFPGAVKNNAPLLKLRVKHREFGDLSTQIYFDSHPKNVADPDLLKVDLKKRNLLIAKGRPVDPSGRYEGRIYEIDLVLDGVSNYRFN